MQITRADGFLIGNVPGSDAVFHEGNLAAASLVLLPGKRSVESSFLHQAKGIEVINDRMLSLPIEAIV